MQFFKGEDIEVKLCGSAQQVFTQLHADLTAWFNDAYGSAGLGEIIYDDNLVPLTRGVARSVFVKNYARILKQWEYVGSFESYLLVFQQIFGPNTAISFVRLSPGALQINITTRQTDLYRWLTSKKNGDYVTDHDGNFITLHGISGIGNFYEVQNVLDSLNPAGIYLEVNFTLTGE